MTQEKQIDVYNRLDMIEKKIDLIIAMINMKKSELNQVQYLDFINSVQEKKFVPDQVLFDDDNDVI